MIITIVKSTETTNKTFCHTINITTKTKLGNVTQKALFFADDQLSDGEVIADVSNTDFILTYRKEDSLPVLVPKI